MSECLEDLLDSFGTQLNEVVMRWLKQYLMAGTCCSVQKLQGAADDHKHLKKNCNRSVFIQMWSVKQNSLAEENKNIPVGIQL